MAWGEMNYQWLSNLTMFDKVFILYEILPASVFNHSTLEKVVPERQRLSPLNASIIGT